MPGPYYPSRVTIPDPPTDRPQRTPGLRVGHVPGVTLTKWRRIWADRHRRIQLEVVEVAQKDQRLALDDGLVDMCFVRLPVSGEGLHTIRLYDEVPVVVVPKDHPLAAFDEVSLAGLAGETLVLDDDSASGVDRVAWGAGILRLPHSIARSHSRRDLVYRPITDAEPTTIALAWLVDNPNELIEEFVGIVRGRTANSSRTAQAKAAKAEPVAKPAAPPAKRGAPKGARRPGGSRPGRGQRHR